MKNHEITYGSRKVGGTSAKFQIVDAYRFAQRFDALELGFTVKIVAESWDDLQAAAAAFESDFSKRDQDLAIQFDANRYQFDFGTGALNTAAEVQKSGDIELDYGVTRTYDVTITAQLPETERDGLQEYAVTAARTASSQHELAFSGVYTRSGGVSASTLYRTKFPAKAAEIQSAMFPGVTFERIDDVFDTDRNDHRCEFSAQFRQLLDEQSAGLLDDPAIRDHTLNFLETAQHIPTGGPDIVGLYRVAASFECALDIDTSPDREAIAKTIRSHITDRFVAIFEPQQFAIEEHGTPRDLTGSRLAVSVTYVYQPAHGTDVVAATETVGYRESRAPSYTWTHSGGELDGYADPGFATVQRFRRSVVTVVGSLAPRARIEDTAVSTSGWNIISSTSEARTEWIGDVQHGDTQMQLSHRTDEVISQLNRAPGGGHGGIRNTVTPEGERSAGFLSQGAAGWGPSSSFGPGDY